MTGTPHVSMEDVARYAGVSIATVSRTLRGMANVADSTRRRVLQAADELSYVVSPIASRLATGRTGTVGVVVPYASRWYFGQVVAGAESVLRDNGLDLLLYNLGDHATRQRFLDHQPLRRRVDAALIVAMPFTESELAALRAVGVPMAAVGFECPHIPSVRIDETATVDQAMRHLLGLGHRRIGMISTYADQNMWLPVAHERRTGYLAALEAAGIPHDPELVVSVPFGIHNGERATRELLALADRPTAILAESDELAFGALAALRRHGLDVPGDVSVIGIDDHDLSSLLDLTTMRQLVADQGAVAANILVRALRGQHEGTHADTGGPSAGEVDAGGPSAGQVDAGGPSADGLDTPITITIPTTLVLRGSTGPASRGTASTDPHA